MKKTVTRKYSLLVVAFLISWIGFAQVKDQIQIRKNDIKIEQEEEYDKIEGFLNYTSEVGAPELPMITRTYVIPINSKVKGIDLVKTKQTPIGDKLRIFPKQKDIPTNSNKKVDWIEPNARIYNQSQEYPGKLYEIVSDRIEQGYHIVTLDLYPFQYVPNKGELKCYDLDFTIQYDLTDFSEVNISDAQSLYRYELTAAYIRSVIRNPQDVERFGSNVANIYEGKRLVRSQGKSEKGLKKAQSKTPSILEEIIPDYIIITNQALKSSFQPLADWKTKKGVFTRIVTVEEIAAEFSGIDLTDKIRNYLKKSVEKWGEGLFVLLGGDIDIVPSRLVLGEEFDSKLYYPTDAYYKNINGYYISVFPDYTRKWRKTFSNNVVLGRLPVKSAEQVNNYTLKLIKYEKSLNVDRNYYKNNLFASAYMSKSDKLSNCHHETIKEIANNSLFPSILNNKFIFDSYSSVDTSKYVNTGWASGDIELNHDNMISLLNKGGLGVGMFHFIFSLDHGSADNMGTSSIDKAEAMSKFEMDKLTNESYTQIMLATQCHPADFSKDCFAEHYINKAVGGGVAYIGNTDVGWIPESDDQLSNFMNNLYINPTLSTKNIGAICNLICVGTGFSNYRLHLLGDPEMPIWTNVPQNMSVRVSGQNDSQAILIGSEQNIVVTISGIPTDRKAMICIRKGDEIYETRRVSSGTTLIPVIARTEGTIEVTVTAQNYLPYETTVYANKTTSPNVVISNIVLDDDRIGVSKGNGNGANDSGETIEMKIEFSNTGILPTDSSVTAQVTKKSDYLSFTNTSVTIPALSSGEKAIGNFVYTISKEAPDLFSNSTNSDSLFFEVTINEGTRQWVQSFKLDNRCPKLNIVNRVLSPFSAGSFVDVEYTMTNTGVSPINNLIVDHRKTGLDNSIDYCESNILTFSEILPRQSVSGILRLKLLGSYSGGPIRVELVARNEFDASFISNSDLSIRNNASSTMTTKSTDKDISLTVNNPLNGVNYLFYRSENLAGPYIRITAAPLSLGNYKDDTIEPLLPYYYKYSVLKGDNESELSQAVTAYTTCPTFAQFPIQMNATNGMASSGINAIDTDGDGKKELFSAMRYTVNTNENFGKLIGLNYDGTELYNIDGNTTTNFGFADFNERLEATPAIADLSNNGTKQVICMTRSTTNNASSLKCYSTLDEDNDKMPDLIGSWGGINDIFRGPIVSNFDNSIDGTEEVIGYSTGGDIYSFSIDPTQKNIKLNWNINPTNSKWAAGAYSIGDVDGDGNKELVYVHDNDHIYIISSNGKIKNTIQSTGRFYDGSIVLADLNKDGIDEIISTIALTKDGSQNRHIVVYRYSSGSYSRYGNWNESSTQQISDMSKIGTLECSVGDIDGDGQLEVVARGNLCIKVWSHDGVLKRTISTDCKNTEKVVPILADVDGDSEAEIIILSGCSPKVYAYKMSTGDQTKGFPIEIANSSTYSTPCVSDVDGDGYNELIVAVDENVYAWKTLGRSDRIEWGSERHDHRNSGRYYPTNPQTIESTVNWTFGRDVHTSYHIKSGGQLNITSSQINLLDQAKIIIENGGTLTLDGGSLLFANIEVQSGGKLVLKNNAKIALSRKGEMKVLHGGSFENLSGQVVPFFQ